jgi:hypothetical protein
MPTSWVRRIEVQRNCPAEVVVPQSYAATPMDVESREMAWKRVWGLSVLVDRLRV